MSQKKSATKTARTPKAQATRKSDSPMDVSLLEQIVQLMSENDLNTVDVRDGQRRIILKRGQAVIAGAPAPVYAQAPAAQAPAAAGSAPAAPAAPAADANLIPIKSPMVGTFYNKPSPDAKAFVSVGSSVDDDTDVCIIEAMKVFNNIKAECRGTIARICVEDRQAVEFGTVLFMVKP